MYVRDPLLTYVICSFFVNFFLSFEGIFAAVGTLDPSIRIGLTVNSIWGSGTTPLTEKKIREKKRQMQSR